MSTPTDSVAPAPPTGTSNPWSLVQWWKRICDWIAALSPSGADKYDTGWVAGTFDGGLAGAIEYRRVGRTVYVRWYISTSMNAGQLWAPAFTAPAGFRPSSAFAQGVAASAYGNSAYPITARILPNGQCQMRNNHTATVTNSNGYAVYLAD